VHGLDLEDVDIKKKQITVMGKGKRKRSWTKKVKRIIVT